MAKFLSKCQNQILCMVPNRVQIVDGITVAVSGKAIRFDRGEYETEDKKEIDFIREHALFGVSITEVEDQPAKGKGAKKDDELPKEPPTK